MDERYTLIVECATPSLARWATNNNNNCSLVGNGEQCSFWQKGDNALGQYGTTSP